MKNALQVDVSNRHIHTEATVIDGNAILWTCNWTSKRVVEDLAGVYLNYQLKHLADNDTFLVFDRYHNYSIKGVTRAKRTKNIALKHTLALKTRLPEIEIAFLAEYITSKVAGKKICKRLFVTPLKKHQLWFGMELTQENEMRTSHEEADLIIVKQCYGAVTTGYTTLKVISDDTDVFALLVFFYSQQCCTHGSLTVVDIGAAVEMLLPMHALTGCDSASRLFGIGKNKAINTCIKKSLILLGYNYASKKRSFQNQPSLLVLAMDKWMVLA